VGEQDAPSGGVQRHVVARVDEVPEGERLIVEVGGALSGSSTSTANSSPYETGVLTSAARCARGRSWASSTPRNLGMSGSMRPGSSSPAPGTAGSSTSRRGNRTSIPDCGRGATTSRFSRKTPPATMSGTTMAGMKKRSAFRDPMKRRSCRYHGKRATSLLLCAKEAARLPLTPDCRQRGFRELMETMA